jgi:2-isopropylmalate synthase
LVQISEYCNRLPVHQRHPYAGELVFTAFSGSHQDAINKGFKAREELQDHRWAIPYLPIDPKDVGRSYEAVIRINSQSGKGGIAYVIEQDYGLTLPRRLQIEFGQVVQRITDVSGQELSSQALWDAFDKEYLSSSGRFEMVDHQLAPDMRDSDMQKLTVEILDHGARRTINGYGNGPIDAFAEALDRECGVKVQVNDYHEHSVGQGADAIAIAYMEVVLENGTTFYGVGRHTSIVTASLYALVSAVNRSGARES